MRVHTIGRRLGDVDGRSAKACIDSFTKAGVWRDDSHECVKEVSFTQELGDEDQTIITVEKIESEKTIESRIDR